jgi:hypothetical protein
LITGFAGGAVIIAVFLYQRDPLEECEDEKAYLYLWKYQDEFDLLKLRELTKEELKLLQDKTISDTTPDGDVTMCYSYTMEAFWYFSESKNVSFKYLDVLAQKYVIQYDCKSIYIVREEIEVDSSEQREVELDDDIMSDAVFITRKSSNVRRKVKKSNRFTYKGTKYQPETKFPSRGLTFAGFKTRNQKD